MFDPREGRSGIFTTERQGLRRASRVIVVCLCLGFAITSAIWFVFISGYFHVSQVNIEGLKELKGEEVTSSTFSFVDTGSWKPWDKRNIFFIDAKRLEQQLKEELFAEQVTVEKKYPNVLRLIVKERQRSIVLVSKGQFLLVDAQGIVTAEAPVEILESARQRLADAALVLPTDLPVVVHELPEPAAVGYQAADGEGIRGWLESSQRLIEARIRFRYLEVPDLGGTTMKVRTDGNIFIILERGPQLAVQVESYRKFMDSKKKELVVKEYVDVRIPGKIFFK